MPELECNKEVARSYFSMLGAIDIDGIQRLFADYVEYHVPNEAYESYDSLLVENIFGPLLHSSEDVGGGSFWGRSLDQIGAPEVMEQALQSGNLPGMSSLPIHRLCRPEGIAYLALFLAPERSGYITGQLISVSGGAYMP